MEACIRKFLEEHVLFKEYANFQFITTLISVMKPRLFVDGSFIIRKGEIGRAMFFNLKGFVDVISEDGETRINTMEEGSFFGEIGVLFLVPRTASCISRGKSIMLILTKEALERALAPYPKIAILIAQIAEQRYAAYLKKLESKVHESFGDEVTTAITHQDLQKVSIFNGAPVEFLRSLALALEPDMYFRNQIIFRKGDAANAIYFVAKGTAEVIDEATSTVYSHFSPGSYFGEVALFMGNQARTATVHCSSQELVLFKCSKKSFNEILSEYPDILQKIELEMHRRMEYINHRNRAHLNPEQLQATEIETVRDKLKLVPIFAKADMNFLHTLVIQLRIERFIPGEIIFNQGEESSCMYLVVDGVVQILSTSGNQIFGEMGKDSYFGEVSLFYDTARTATAKTKTETTLIVLEKHIVMDALKGFEELQDSIKAMAKVHYENFLKRTEKVKDGKDGKSIEVVANSEFTVLDRLSNVSIFKQCDYNFLKDIASHVTVKIFKKNEIIFNKGALATEMYFLAQGSVQVMSEDQAIVYDKIDVGGFFGEIGTIKGKTRNAILISSSEDTITLVLSGDQIKSSLKNFPDSYHAIILACDERDRKAEARGNVVSTGDLCDTNSETVISMESPKEQQHAVAGPIMTEFRPKKFVKELISKKLPLKGNQEISRNFFFQKIDFENIQIDSSNLGTVKNILDLNELQLSIVLRALPFLEKFRLGLVCKKMRKFIQSYIFFQNLNLPTTSYALLNKIFDSLSTIGGDHIENLNLSHSGELTDDGLKIVSQNCINIKKLILKSCWKLGDPSLSHIGTHLQKLVTLDISHCNRMTGAGFEKHKMVLLTIFNASHCKALGDKSLEMLFSSTPGIKEIRIRRCTRLTEFSIFLIARFCRNVQIVDASDCVFITNRCLKWLSTACLHLRYLSLSFCVNVTHSGFQKIAQGSVMLQSLDLSYCTQVTDSTIIMLDKCLKKLMDLKLRGCVKITDAIASHLAIHARELRSLDVTACPSITPAFSRILKIVNRGVKIRETQSRISRKVYTPGHPLVKNSALELQPREIFTSGPKGLMKDGIFQSDMIKDSDINVKKFMKLQAKKAVAKTRKNK